ncbi:MAG TPA: preprotein translocase subunit SecE [Planctomycetaceae bacterium]|nr:preprotein translocase subunit SecE [Planctomycetaceae bacterium]|tara:strand:- start:4561 stop:5100 length:540 start_codon:yes stop_codon:yes gene_type:complete
MAKANALSQGKAGRASGSSAGSQKKASNRSLGDLFWLLPGSIYKRNQGRVARQVTFAALAVTVMMAAWSFYGFLRGGMVPDFWSNLAGGAPLVTVYAPAGVFLLGGCWISFRVVAGWPRFSDFLISVEAEMVKVSWPSRGELYRASLVVVVVIFFMAILLFGFDLFWRYLFQFIGVLKN